MNQDSADKIEQISKDVHEIRSVLLGVDGQEGLLRRVAALEKHKSEVETAIAKIIGGVLVIGSVASFLGTKIATWVKIDPK